MDDDDDDDDGDDVLDTSAHSHSHTHTPTHARVIVSVARSQQLQAVFAAGSVCYTPRVNHIDYPGCVLNHVLFCSDTDLLWMADGWVRARVVCVDDVYMHGACVYA